MATTRKSGPDRETAAAVDRLVRARAEVLYALGAALAKVEDARAAIQAAEQAHSDAVAAAVKLQESAVREHGWSPSQLRDAGLYVDAPATVRRRRSVVRPTPSADDQTPDESVSPVTDQAPDQASDVAEVAPDDTAGYASGGSFG